MDEKLARKLSRQLRLLNFLIVFFALVFMAIFAIAGIFAYKAVQEIRDAKSTLTTVQQKAEDTLNVTNSLCEQSVPSAVASSQAYKDACN